MIKNKKGTSFSTRYILNNLGSEKVQELSSYIEQVLKEEFVEFTSVEQINKTFLEIVRDYIDSLSLKELSDLRFYTGYEYRFINNTMRNKWNYEENGLLTSEKKEYYQQLGESIKNIIDKFPSLNINIKSYRGISIKAFYDYGITTISDLSLMQGQYIYEQGFTSTSLLRNTSYFRRKDLEWHDTCNIEIEYFVPSLCQDGAILLSDVLSYSKSQLEYILNCGSLSKIIKVEINEEQNTAKLSAILLPKSLWNQMRLKESSGIKK